MKLRIGLTADDPDITDKHVLKGDYMVKFVGNYHNLRVFAFGACREAELKAVVLANCRSNGLTHKATGNLCADVSGKSPYFYWLFALKHHVRCENARHLKFGAIPAAFCLFFGFCCVCGGKVHLGKASSGFTKNAGVPVLAIVEAIFAPMCPDLPTPVTMSLPLLSIISSMAFVKLSSKLGIRFRMA